MECCRSAQTRHSSVGGHDTCHTRKGLKDTYLDTSRNSRTTSQQICPFHHIDVVREQSHDGIVCKCFWIYLDT